MTQAKRLRELLSEWLPSGFLVAFLWFIFSSRQLLVIAKIVGSMRFISLAATCVLASTALARTVDHVRKADMPKNARGSLKQRQSPPAYGGPSTNSTILPQNANTTKFAVDGTAIPDVDFDIGESYAGLLPISDKANSSELYFWFFPSANELAGDEILIWLNGGPGCSSLEGLLQENGPCEHA